MKYSFFKYEHTFIFLVLILLVAMYYDYPSQFDMGPRSVHQWRQSDGASMALVYYEEGMKLLEPKVHHVLGGSGKGVGEFPIFYYAVAGLYHVFGVHDGIFRLLCFLVLVAGLWGFSKTILHFVGDNLLSFALPILLLSSPLIAYYGFNFMTNIPALGFALLGLYAFFRFFKSQRLSWLWLSSFWFLLGGLLKITALLTFIPIVGIWFLELLGVYKFQNGKRLFEQKWLAALPFILVLGLTFLWYWWADSYNQTYATTYFRIGGYPFWELDQAKVEYLLQTIYESWADTYFHKVSHIVFILSILFIIFTPRKHPTFLYLMLLVALLGGGFYFFYLFEGFATHDYYMINMAIIPMLALVTLGYYLKIHRRQLLNAYFFKIIILAFVCFNLYHAKSVLNERYDPQGEYMTMFPSIYHDEELPQFIADMGLKYPDLVISYEDRSPNSSLYLMNLKGWSSLYHNGQYSEEKIQQLVNYGAKALILNDKELLDHPAITPFLSQPLGVFKEELYFYDLQGLRK